MLALRTLGGLSLARDGEAVAGAGARKRPLALLATLAAAGPRGLSRATLTGRLWSESDESRARGVLAQTIYGLRRDLGHDDLLLDGAELRLNPARIGADVIEFNAAIADGDDERAVSAYGGAFLDGFYLTDEPSFERWVEEERATLAQLAASALERVARARAARGDHSAAVAAWRRLAAMTPLNARVVLGLMDALADSGDAGGAIQAAHVHASLVREELGAEPDAAVQARAERLRRGEGIAPVQVEVRSTVPSAETEATPVVARTSPLAVSHDILEPARAPRRSRRRLTPLAVLVVGAGMIAAYAAAAPWRAIRAPSPVTGLVAVLPFRVTGADPSLAYLREGMMDLLAADLASDRGAGAADPRAVLSALRTAGSLDGALIDDGTALVVARRLGAETVLLGSVVGTGSRVELRATLLGASDGRTRARAEAAGPADSLAALVDRLVVGLLARSATRDPAQSDALAGMPLGLLRAYVDGQSAYRRGEYELAMADYSRALDVDSSFGLAAIGLFTAGNWVAATDFGALDRGLRLAYAARDRMPARDRATVAAWVGPRYPGVRRASSLEDVVDWERVVAAAPDRAEVWYELGDRYFHGGPFIGVADGWARAEVSFRRALALDSTFTPPLGHLLELAASNGDTARVRALSVEVESRAAASDVADFLRWRAAVALDDAPARAALRAGLATMSVASLERIVGSAQLEGVALEDADSAAAVLVGRAATPAERSEAALLRLDLARNRGRPPDILVARQALRQSGVPSATFDRVMVMNDLVAPDRDVPRADVEAMLGRLAAVSAHVSSTGVLAEAERDVARCTVELWRAAHGRIDSTEAIVERLRRARPIALDSGQVQLDRELCVALLDAQLQDARRGPHARSALMRADSLSREGRLQFPMIGANASNIVIARLWEREGDLPRALAALRRRSYHWTLLANLTTILAEEGRIAARAGDRAGALRAYRHYLTLYVGGDAVGAANRARIAYETARLAAGR